MGVKKRRREALSICRPRAGRDVWLHQVFNPAYEQKRVLAGPLPVNAVSCFAQSSGAMQVSVNFTSSLLLSLSIPGTRVVLQ